MIDSNRRALLRSGSALPAAWAVGLAGAGALLPDAALAKDGLARLWRSADILIGHSPSEQAPALSINCPLFFQNGHSAQASHSLDLGTFPVGSDIRWEGGVMVPNLGASLAVSVTMGTDGQPYLLVGAEGPVTGARGRFSGVERAIVRCKYKVVPASPMPLLVSCVYCVVILVQD